MCAGVLTESRGTAGDAVYTRVERLIEGGANRAAREAATSLAPENEPPMASVQDMVRQVSCHNAKLVQASTAVICKHASSEAFTGPHAAGHKSA